jgi:hypothetical protein
MEERRFCNYGFHNHFPRDPQRGIGNARQGGPAGAGHKLDSQPATRKTEARQARPGHERRLHPRLGKAASRTGISFSTAVRNEGCSSGRWPMRLCLQARASSPGSSSTRDSIFPSRIWIRRSQQRFENERDRTLPLPQGTECPKSIRRGLSYRRPWITRPVDAVTLPFFLAARFTARSCISCPSFDLLIETCMIRLMMLPVIQ